MIENGTFSLGAVNSVVEESVLMTILPALGSMYKIIISNIIN